MMSLARPAVDYWNNPLGYSYTSIQVDAALRMVGGVPRTMYFRYNLLDQNNNFKKQLTTVVDGSGTISYDYTQQIKRTGTFTIQDDSSINFLSDRMQPFALLRMPDGNYAQFPLGVFLLSTPPQQTDGALVVTRQVQAYDLNQVLVDWKTTDRYTIPAGTNYISTVQTLLTEAGITATNLTATTLTLPTALDYPGGTSYLDIINDLLTQINYRTLWFDENGVAIAQPWVSPAVQTPAYTYVDDANSIIYPQVSRSLDLFAVPNVWVVVVAQTDQSEIVSTYTNSNPNSPTSTVNRGRQIVHYEQNMNAPLSQTLDSFAQQLAFNDSQVYDTVTYPTAICPMHQDYDTLQFTFSALGVSDKFSEVGWSFPLKAGGQMQHTVRRVVPV